MSKLLLNAKKNLREILLSAIGQAIAKNQLPEATIEDFLIEIPAQKTHGDFATNIAMISAKSFKMSPIKIAKIISENIDLTESEFEKFEVVSPGFINFFLKREFLFDVVLNILNEKQNYGKSDFGKGQKVNIEFVSANPTGPMHMGNARGGALGDCLASVMQEAGFDVTREFYINDAGNQIDKFALSLDIRYQQIFKGEENIELPEECYQGDDIKELALKFAQIHNDSYLFKDQKERQKALVEFALPINIKKMHENLDKYRIYYDVWFKESKLHEENKVNEVIEKYKKLGLTYEKDGALFLKTKDEEKDEVLVRANGTPTYFAADIAYHVNKFNDRHFDRCIDIWGADHHGHVARLKAALQALGVNSKKLDIILMQLVRLKRDGQITKMSKRTGKALQLEDLLNEVSTDSARFIFNLREANSQMDFDLSLAVKQDSQNPVYYVQYAHARICSIIKNIKNADEKIQNCSYEDLKLLTKEEEIDLIKHLSTFTDEIINSAKNYDPAKITRYVIELATLFHKFYNACKVNTNDETLTKARLALCLATKITIKNILDMFKISAPESM